MKFPLYIASCFSLIAFRIPSLFLASFILMITSVVICLWGIVYLKLSAHPGSGYVFLFPGQVSFQASFLEITFLAVSLSLFLLKILLSLFCLMCIKYHMRYLYFKFLFLFFCSVGMCSISLSSNSMIHSST